MRITFLGGGTDFPEFFNKQEGATLSATINKFVYVLTNEQPPFVRDKFKFTYRKTESVDSVAKIQHPVVRKVLEKMSWEVPLNIATMADLPGGSGLGSSSAFTAALIQNLNSRRSLNIFGNDLARESIHIERELLKEPGGWQDQLATTFAGMRMYSYFRNDFTASHNSLTDVNSGYFSRRMILIRVPSTRKGLASAQANQTFVGKHTDSSFLRDLSIKTREVWEGINKNTSPESQFRILQEGISFSWGLKRNWGSQFQTNHTTALTRKLTSLGVKNMKLVGAGDGGFILVAEEPEIIQNITDSLDSSLLVNFEMHSEPVRTEKYV